MQPITTDGGLQIAVDDDSASAHAVVAALEQLFTGLHVGSSSLKIRCSGCSTQLGEGDQVSVYAYRTVETPSWQLARCRCPDCAPSEITTPTLGATEVRIRARLAVISDVGRQQHQLCLVEPTVTAVARPQNCSPP